MASPPAGVAASVAMKGETKTEKEAVQMGEKSDLPTAIIIKDVPRELFDDPKQKENFTSMFDQISSDIKPEHATAAKLLVEHHSFNGIKMKAFFAKNIKMTRRAYQDEAGHLTLPPLEKQFLISPPSSPPVGWVQHAEMAPVVCDFDLMARLASLTVDDKFELFEGDEHQRRPSIVITPCEKGGGGGLLGNQPTVSVGNGESDVNEE
uniref:Calcipressin-like protein n=1 Tax=Globodera rostochiensis TaxID=31243 RepID=A0A914IAB5_GLORO